MAPDHQTPGKTGGPLRLAAHRLGAWLEARARWTDDDVTRHVGVCREAWLAHARDERVRDGAASGGAVSAILLSLLAQGGIDGALVWRAQFDADGPRLAPRIATTAGEIVAARSSKYLPGFFMRDAAPLIRAFDGRLAVVVLPCEAMALKCWRAQAPDIDGKIALVLALFCGHTSSPELTRETLRKLGVAGEEVAAFCYSTGPWKGRLVCATKDGRHIERSAAIFKNYQSLYFHCDRRCLACVDHFGYDADISAGDVWLRQLSGRAIKPSCLVIRTAMGTQAFEAARSSLALEPLAPRDVLAGQARAALTHYNLSARARAGRLFGLRLRDRQRARVRWSEWLVAAIVALNYRWSRSASWRGVIRRIPAPMIRLYLFAFTALQQLAVMRRCREGGRVTKPQG